MPTQCNVAELRLKGPGRREVAARFDGGRMSSEGGAVLLREADRVVGVTAKLASCFMARRAFDAEQVVSRVVGRHE